MTFNVPIPNLPSLSLSRRGRVALAVVAAIVVLIVIGAVYVGEYTDLLWFRSVGFSSVFSRRLVTEIVLFLIFGAAMAVVVGVNVVVAYRHRPPFRPVSQEQEQLEALRQSFHRFRIGVLAVVLLLLAVITGAAASKRWQTWLLWRNGTSFHHKDPQFHKDVSYFAFTYPMQRFVLGTLFAIVVVSLIAVLATCYLYGALRLQTPGPKWSPAGRAHVSVLLGLFVLLKAAAYWLDRYGLAFSGRGSVTGPSYTDVNAVLPAKTILVFVAVICALLFFANVVTRNWQLPAIAFGLMVLSALLIGGAFPALVQQFKVKPSQQDLEAKYIGRNIAQTQIAYGISQIDSATGQGSVKVQDYGAASSASTTSPKQFRRDATKVAQLRLLDPNVVSQTFEQLQQQRSFYTFPETLDIDRYTLPNEPGKTDLVIGTRDVNLAGLQPGQRNWINQHLVYTHGYGVAAAQADTIGSHGAPSFVESDLPPTGSLGSFQSQIYFGESSPSYSIVGAPAHANPRELDLPSDTGVGQRNTTYTGTGGVPIGSSWRQLLYALKFKDKNVFLSSGVNAKSQLLYIRDPRDRVHKVAPWLTLDGDSYPVVVGGHIEWVVDGYTTTSGFPYSEQESLGSSTQTSLTTRSNSVAAQSNRHINYIRNSVKATVDAYSGQVTLYEWDQTPSASTSRGTRDPVLATWEKAFPGVVKPQSDMPADLVAHLRYPEDLFNIQRTLIAHYHVTDPKSFYNGTEFWNVPYDPTVKGNVSQPAYYFTMSPDGSTSTAPVFSLTSPLVSLNRRNLTAYLSVNSEPGPDYGKFLLLQVPANQVTDGPQQVQNNIESTPAVSTQLSLLRQGGSRVTLGNLLTVPIDNDFLYVEPIYVQSAGAGSFPVLRQVAAVSDGNVAYQGTLSAALDQVFGVKGAPAAPSTPSTPSTPTSPTKVTSLASAIADAQQAEADAKEALTRGDFAAYGEAEDRLSKALSRIAKAAQATSAPSPAASSSP